MFDSLRFKFQTVQEGITARFVICLDYRVNIELEYMQFIKCSYFYYPRMRSAFRDLRDLIRGTKLLCVIEFIPEGKGAGA
jgi:hypothetical protein